MTTYLVARAALKKVAVRVVQERKKQWFHLKKVGLTPYPMGTALIMHK